MRSLVLAVVALLLGAALTVIGLNAARQATAYPNGMMSVMAAQMKALDNTVKKQQCDAESINWRVQSMRLLATDLEFAFAPTGDDQQFATDSAALRNVLDTALSKAPATCAQVNVTLDKINAVCHDCHRDFRD